jgi:hypothetical protein
MTPRSISEIALAANPEIAWKPPWQSLSASLSCHLRRASSASSGLPRTTAENLFPARPGRARDPPPSLPLLLLGPLVDT